MPEINAKMARARVMSFMAGLQNRSPSDKTEGSRQSSRAASRERAQYSPTPKQTSFSYTPQPTPPPAEQQPPPVRGRQRAVSRPMSMIGGYQAPLMPVASDTIPELAPVFTLLNSHQNKLYQEGYFLKLNDLDTHGRPYPDRLWTESFAQLVGTVLSLWDAAELDAAGDDGEVAPTFINLGDASIKMIESLPTRSGDTQPLTNVLSVSTAGKNRYLLHFSTINALTQWTAGIRLAMYENASLQEAYTGSLIAGKGRSLNNIKMIMERSRFKTEEWTRVRFGAGTPWRRCWCVVSPPDDKELQAQKKQMKKRSAYDRGPQLKGDIKFYDTRKITKKTRPVATITEAFSAYAIYPQSKALIDQSTLIKIEGPVTIHTNPEVTTEGFIFVMPESHPAVTGFEMLLRFLFPVWDVFLLYGRPMRLVPDTLDVRSLMFAMPKSGKHGYLEIFDVVTLINNPGSQSWSEREWKKQLKQLTSQRMNRTPGRPSQTSSRVASHHGHRNSLPSRGVLRFQDNAMRSTPSLQRDMERQNSPPPPPPPPHADSAPPSDGGPYVPPHGPPSGHQHQRSVSDAAPISPRRQRENANYTPSRFSQEAVRPRMSFEQDDQEELPPLPPKHDVPLAPPHYPNNEQYDSDDSGRPFVDAYEHRGAPSPYHNNAESYQAFAPVVAPPAFSHEPGAVPATRPSAKPELRRANSRMSSATLSQLHAAGNFHGNQSGPPPPMPRGGRASEDMGPRGVNDYNETSPPGMTADDGLPIPGMALAGVLGQAPSRSDTDVTSTHSASPPNSPHRPSAQDTSQQNLQAPVQHQLRSTSPLSQATSASDVAGAKYPSTTDSNGPTSSQTQLPFRPADDRPSTAGSGASDPQRPTARPALISQKSIARKPLPSQSPARSEFPPRTTSVYYDQPLPIPAEAITDHPAYRHQGGENDHIEAYSADEYSGDQELIGAAPPAVDRDRPRSGALRTVGNTASQDVVIGDARYQPAAARGSGGEPWNVDFGPTHLYTPGVPTRKPVSAEGSPSGRASTSHGHSREASSSSPNFSIVPTPEKGQSRATSEDRDGNRRSWAWQPGTAMGSPARDNAPGLTPEQYVQQRAAAGRPAAPYGQRQQAGTPPLTQRPNAETPPRGASRNSSGDWSAGRGQHFRPDSRGRGPGGSTDLTARLSAREQEQVARMSGSPLVNIGNNPPNPQLQDGLMGAIDQREREKRDMRTMASNMAGQNANHRITPPMHVPGNFPATPQYYDGGWEEGYVQGSPGRTQNRHATSTQQDHNYGYGGESLQDGPAQYDSAPYRGSYRPNQDYRR